MCVMCVCCLFIFGLVGLRLFACVFVRMFLCAVVGLFVCLRGCLSEFVGVCLVVCVFVRLLGVSFFVSGSVGVASLFLSLFKCIFISMYVVRDTFRDCFLCFVIRVRVALCCLLGC